MKFFVLTMSKTTFLFLGIMPSFLPFCVKFFRISGEKYRSEMGNRRTVQVKLRFTTKLHRHRQKKSFSIFNIGTFFPNDIIFML